MENVTLYWLPHCSTCKKAKEFIENKGVAINNFHDLKAQPLLPEAVVRLAKMVGGIDKLFSRRAIKYRELGFDKREISDAEMKDLMSREYTFIKRPVLVIGESATAGFSEKTYSDILQK